MTTEEIIYRTAIADGMPANLALLMVGQSKLESGNYQHQFFTIGKNAFGYSYDRNSQWQLDLGGPNADNGIPIAQYANVEDSTHEITSWIKRRQNDGQFPRDLNVIKTPAQYARYLIDGSHPYYDVNKESEYAAAILYWLGTIAIDPLQATGIGLIVLIFVALVLTKTI